MKSSLIALMAASFIAVSLFGFSVMGGQNGEHAGHCVASTFQGAPCPQENNGFDFASFHISAFRDFLAATANFNSLSVLLALLILALAGIMFKLFERNEQIQFLDFSRTRQFFIGQRPNRFKIILISWLKFHENSPSFVLSRI